MDNKKAEELLNNYNEGLATSEEIRLVENWFIEASVQSQKAPIEADYLDIKTQMWAAIKPATIQPRHRRMWPLVASIAAAISVIALGIWFFSNPLQMRGRSTAEDLAGMDGDIAPGQYGATLTLADGKKIRLNDAVNGQLAQEAGVKITKAEDGQLIYEIVPSDNPEGTSHTKNTLSTANGETYQVRLPDGTKAWLNAASSIQYPSSFAGMKQRRVEITGEVYLEVYKDAHSPFIVSSGTQQIEVLGTHFNVKAYADESAVKTTLLEGVVRVSSPQAPRGEVVLKPGQQSQLKGSEMELHDVDVEEIVAWKEGDFRFVDQNVNDIMKQIARWYNVQVVYEDNVSDIKLNASISRNRNVSQVLRMMEKTDEVHFKIEGRRIIVRR